MEMTNKPRSVPLLDELGGKAWVRLLGVRIDDKAVWGPMGTAALVRTVDLPKANRVLIVREQGGGYRVEYWRIDAAEAAQLTEKKLSTLDEVRAELAARFAWGSS